MLDRMTNTAPPSEKLSSALHFALAAAFGLMGLHAAIHIIAHLA